MSRDGDIIQPKIQEVTLVVAHGYLCCLRWHFEVGREPPHIERQLLGDFRILITTTSQVRNSRKQQPFTSSRDSICCSQIRISLNTSAQLHKVGTTPDLINYSQGVASNPICNACSFNLHCAVQGRTLKVFEKYRALCRAVLCCVVLCGAVWCCVVRQVIARFSRACCAELCCAMP